MEVKELPQIILVLLLIAMLGGVSVLTLNAFGNAAVEATAVTNESVTITSGEGALTNVPVLSVSEVRNESDATFDIVTDYNLTGGNGSVYDFAVDGTYYFDYTYNKTTAAVTSANASANAIGTIGSTWMSLIVTIVILSVIIVMVIGGLTVYARKR